MKQIKFYTLGCKVNQYETEVLANNFVAEGFAVTEEEENADIFIVNSCTVTSEGDRKVRQLLRKIKRNNPNGILVLTGCYPQAFPEEVSTFDYVNIITGTKNRSGVVSAVKEFLRDGKNIINIAPHQKGEDFESGKSPEHQNRTRAFLKIQDGCENYCTYCIIPKSRGPIRSMNFEELRTQIINIANSGYKEIVLTGINLTSYGIGTDYRFIDAVRLACNTKGIERVRLGSMEPERLTENDIKEMATFKTLCPQFHLSLQSGSDSVLKRMNRHYSSSEYLQVVEYIKKYIKDSVITTDIIVGFPGETEEEFIETIDFVKTVDFAKIHIFAYSQRSGTAAANRTDQIPQNIKKERSHRLMKVEEELRHKYMQHLVGKTVSVLIEEKGRDGLQRGYTMAYIPVAVTDINNLQGKIVDVYITNIIGDECQGILNI